MTFCGPDVLGLLAVTDAGLRAYGRSLLVRDAQPQQARIFRLSGLGHLLAVGDRSRA